MSKKLSALACCLMLGVVACTDTGLEDKVNSLESRVAKLESEVSRLNSDFVTLKSLVDKLSNGYLVESCTPVADGYLIKFTDNTSVTIRHGKDGTDGVDGTNGTNGQDGKTPSIGLRKDELDGNWYWTLNGEWLKDASGNRVKANGTDGKDGVTPQVKVEDGYWWLSTDGGISWTVLSPYYDVSD